MVAFLFERFSVMRAYPMISYEKIRALFAALTLPTIIGGPLV